MISVPRLLLTCDWFSLLDFYFYAQFRFYKRILLRIYRFVVKTLHWNCCIWLQFLLVPNSKLLGLECTHSLMIRFDKGNRTEKINDPFLWITSQGSFFPTERPPILETDRQKKEHEMVVKTSIGVQSSSWLLDEKMARKTSRAFFLHNKKFSLHRSCES